MSMAQAPAAAPGGVLTLPAEVTHAQAGPLREALGRQAPGRMTDGRTPWPRPFDQGFDPDDPIDRAVMATREAVFPHFGLVAEPGLWF